MATIEQIRKLYPDQTASMSDTDIIQGMSATSGLDPQYIAGRVGVDVSAPGFVPTLKRSAAQFAGGVGEVYGDVSGNRNNGLSRFAQDVEFRNPSGVNSLSDIVDKPGLAVKEAVANGLTFIVPGGALKAAGAGLRGLKMANAARAVDNPLTQAAVAGVPSLAGIGQDQRESGEGENLALKYGASLGVGAVENLGGVQRLMGFGGQSAKRTAAQEVAAFGKSPFRTAMKATGRSMAEEGAEEMIQSPMEQYAGYKDPTSAQSVDETVFGGAMGAIGGVVGAPHGMARGLRHAQIKRDITTDLLNTEQPLSQQLKLGEYQREFTAREQGAERADQWHNAFMENAVQNRDAANVVALHLRNEQLRNDQAAQAMGFGNFGEYEAWAAQNTMAPTSTNARLGMGTEAPIPDGVGQRPAPIAFNNTSGPTPVTGPLGAPAAFHEPDTLGMTPAAGSAPATPITFNPAPTSNAPVTGAGVGAVPVTSDSMGVSNRAEASAPGTPIQFNPVPTSNAPVMGAGVRPDQVKTDALGMTQAAATAPATPITFNPAPPTGSTDKTGLLLPAAPVPQAKQASKPAQTPKAPATPKERVLGKAAQAIEDTLQEYIAAGKLAADHPLVVEWNAGKKRHQEAFTTGTALNKLDPTGVKSKPAAPAAMTDEEHLAAGHVRVEKAGVAEWVAPAAKAKRETSAVQTDAEQVDPDNIPDQNHAEGARMFQAGDSLRTIADTLGGSHQTWSNTLARYGYTEERRKAQAAEEAVATESAPANLGEEPTIEHDYSNNDEVVADPFGTASTTVSSRKNSGAVTAASTDAKAMKDINKAIQQTPSDVVSRVKSELRTLGVSYDSLSPAQKLTALEKAQAKDKLEESDAEDLAKLKAAGTEKTSKLAEQRKQEAEAAKLAGEAETVDKAAERLMLGDTAAAVELLELLNGENGKVLMQRLRVGFGMPVSYTPKQAVEYFVGAHDSRVAEMQALIPEAAELWGAGFDKVTPENQVAFAKAVNDIGDLRFNKHVINQLKEQFSDEKPGPVHGEPVGDAGGVQGSHSTEQPAAEGGGDRREDQGPVVKVVPKKRRAIVREAADEVAPARPAEAPGAKPKIVLKTKKTLDVAPSAQVSVSNPTERFAGRDVDVGTEVVTTTNEAERELRGMAHNTEQPGDLQLGNGKFVSFGTALKYAREAVANGVSLAPFPIHNALDVSVGSASRLVEHLKSKPAADEDIDPDDVDFGDAPSAQIDNSVTLEGEARVIEYEVVGQRVAVLPAPAQAQLEKHYGETAGTEPFTAKVKEDVINFVTKGAEAVHAAVRSIIRQIANGVMSVALIFNPSFTKTPEIVAMPTTTYTTSTGPSTTRAAHAEVPAAAAPHMSEAAKTAYSLIYPAIKADLQARDKLFIVADKPNARIFVFTPDGKLVLQKKSLFGAAVGDLSPAGSNNIKANRITPAGFFDLGMRVGGATAGEYDFKRMFVLDKAGGTYSVSIMHSVWTHESDAAKRLSALKNESAADSRYSFGCINVDRTTFAHMLKHHEKQMDGAKLFIVPDDQAQVDEFLTGATAHNQSGKDGLTRTEFTPVMETIAGETTVTKTDSSSHSVAQAPSDSHGLNEKRENAARNARRRTGPAFGEDETDPDDTPEDLQRAAAPSARSVESPVTRAAIKYAERVAGKSGGLVVTDTAHAVKKLAYSLGSLHDLVREFKERLPSAGKWYEAVQGAIATRKQLEGDAEKIASAADKLKNGTQAVNEFISASTFEQKWGYDPKLPGRQVVVDQKMAAAFDRLTREEQQVVRDVFAHGEKMSDEKFKILKELGFDKGFIGRGKLDGPYAPLKRFGNYVGMLKSKELQNVEAERDRVHKAGQPTTKLDERIKELKADPSQYVVSYFDTMGQARAFATENAKDWHLTDAFEKSQRIGEGRVLPEDVLNKVLAATRANDDLPTEARTAMADMVRQLYFQALDEHNARTSGLKRQNRAGYDKDMVRSFLSNARAEANFLANMKHGGEMNDQFYAMQNEAKDPVSGKRVAQDEFNVIAAHYAENLKYEETPWQDRAMALTSAWQLATSVGYHVTNAMQGIMVTIPKLGADFNNYGGAWSHLMKGYGILKTVGLKDLDLSKIGDANLRAALQRASDMGVLDVGMEENLSHFDATRTGVAGVDKASSLARGALHKLRQVSRMVETANRVSSAVAGYNMALESGRSIQEAQDYAVEILQTTQGDFSRIGAPLLLKKLPKVMTQYRKYQFMMGALYVKAFRDAFLSADLDTRAIGKRMLAYKLFHTSMAAGVLGMPLANVAALVFSAIGGDDDEPADLERTLRDAIGDETLANLLLHGPMGTLLGLDMSAKLGDDKVFSIMPYADWDVSSREGLAKTVVGLAGPAAGQASNFADGVHKFHQGDYYKGLEQFMPKGVASAMKAFRIGNEGFTLTNGDVMVGPEDVSGFSLALDAIGMPSAELKRISWMRGQQYEITKFYGDRTKQLTREYVAAYKSDDVDAMSDIRDQWSALQEGKAKLRGAFNDQGDALKVQSLSTLLKAPHSAVKRELKLQRTVPVE